MDQDWRNSVIEAVDNEIVDSRDMILCLVKYMSQDDIKDCLKINDLLAPEITLVRE